MLKKQSKNKRAEKLMGLRHEGQPLCYPCEMDYHCPVCKYKLWVKGQPDERLNWSEYNGFLWCEVCNKDYPSALCKLNIDDAIDTFLDSVERAIGRGKR